MTELVRIFKEAIDKLGISEGYKLFFEVPRNPEHGDFSTNVSMQLAKPLKSNPRTVAESIVLNVFANKDIVDSIEIAGPGFINVRLTNSYYISEFASALAEKENYGRNAIGHGKKINVEYVSANPTGLLHLGHGRNACIGDTVANLFEWNGWEVTREYYFNNAGNQMNNLGKSVYARYMQLLGNVDFPFPEDGYHGAYINTIAEILINNKANAHIQGTDDDLAVCRKYGEEWCFEKIIETMKAMHVHHDIYYNEDSLYKEDKITEVIDKLRALDLAYDKDGAVWMALTKIGLQDDRVIVKSSGEPTYRLPDIAYHIEKFNRGYDVLVDVFGADHIATIPDVLAGLQALGYNSDAVKVLIHQFVTLTENGEQVKMSKRSGKSYTLDELIEEVGADVVRFFFLMRGITTHLEFDLGLAREQNDKNPVFYLQYAHARICSVIDKAREREITTESNFNLEAIKEKQEINLIKNLLKFPDTVRNACEKFEPQILAEYLRTVAADFHVFYHDLRIIGAESEVQQARLNLLELTKNTIKNGLAILGISAPERM
jgi:arginyl-tRNA synthetase